MRTFVGLDISLKLTAICVVDSAGKILWEGSAESDPSSIILKLQKFGGEIELVGLEACPLSEWIYGGLVECGFNTRCIEV